MSRTARDRKLRTYGYFSRDRVGATRVSIRAKYLDSNVSLDSTNFYAVAQLPRVVGIVPSHGRGTLEISRAALCQSERKPGGRRVSRQK